MKVMDIMTKVAQTIGPDATVEQASQKMRDYNIGLLPVVEEYKLLGAVTERDVVVHAVAEGRHPHLTTVREIMREKPSVCYEDQSITDASKIMEKHHVRRLIVMNRRHQLAGILTITDFALKIPNQELSRHLLHRVAAAA